MKSFYRAKTIRNTDFFVSFWLNNWGLGVSFETTKSVFYGRAYYFDVTIGPLQFGFGQ